MGTKKEKGIATEIVPIRETTFGMTTKVAWRLGHDFLKFRRID